MKRTARDNKLLRDSSIVFREFFPKQLVDGGYFETEDQAEERLVLLEKGGWLGSVWRMLSMPLPSVENGPLGKWSPGDPDDFEDERVSYLARSRWDKLTVEGVRVWFASEKARRYFGGAPLKRGTSLTRWEQACHDSLSTSIALQIKRHRPEVFANLRGEDLVAKLYRGDKLSDFVCGPDLLKPSLVIDCAGSYNARMCQSYYDRWGPNSPTPTPLELW